jgi:hypothetical protein
MSKKGNELAGNALCQLYGKVGCNSRKKEKKKKK